VTPAVAPDGRVALGKFFHLTTDVFDAVPRLARMEWAQQIKDPKYKLTHQQHCFLIGQGWAA